MLCASMNIRLATRHNRVPHYGRCSLFSSVADGLWSMAKLARLQATPATARLLLEDVAQRLTHQIERFQTDVRPLLEQRQQQQQQQQHAALDHLEHLHQDTVRLGQRLLAAPILFQRWNAADQSTVSHAFQQIRDRHAISMERYLDLVLLGSTSSSLSPQEQNKTIQTQQQRCSFLLDDVIQSMLQTRCGVLLLCDHYAKLARQRHDDSPLPHGAVAKIIMDDAAHDSAPTLETVVVSQALAEARHICQVHWLEAPQVLVETSTMSSLSSVTVIRPWLHHTLVELLKNAMHATLLGKYRHQHRRDDDDDDDDDPEDISQLPPTIRVLVSQVAEFVQIDITDEGVGVPSAEDVDVLFRLGQSSSSTTSSSSSSSKQKRWDRLQDQQSYAAVRPPMNSLGVGLPISRILMQYFGGNVQLLSLPRRTTAGCTTTARVLLPVDDTIPEPRHHIGAPVSCALLMNGAAGTR